MLFYMLSTATKKSKMTGMLTIHPGGQRSNIRIGHNEYKLKKVHLLWLLLISSVLVLLHLKRVSLTLGWIQVDFLFPFFPILVLVLVILTSGIVMMSFTFRMMLIFWLIIFIIAATYSVMMVMFQILFQSVLMRWFIVCSTRTRMKRSWSSLSSLFSIQWYHYPPTQWHQVMMHLRPLLWFHRRHQLIVPPTLWSYHNAITSVWYLQASHHRWWHIIVVKSNHFFLILIVSPLSLTDPRRIKNDLLMIYMKGPLDQIFSYITMGSLSATLPSTWCSSIIMSPMFSLLRESLLLIMTRMMRILTIKYYHPSLGNSRKRMMLIVLIQWLLFSPMRMISMTLPLHLMLLLYHYVLCSPMGSHQLFTIFRLRVSTPSPVSLYICFWLLCWLLFLLLPPWQSFCCFLT